MCLIVRYVFIEYMLMFRLFVFRQKTAYVMRIIDLSSDLCSSDLARRATVRMAFRVAADADLEIADLLQAGDQVGGIGIALGMGDKAAAAFRRIAAERDDMADAGFPVEIGRAHV